MFVNRIDDCITQQHVLYATEEVSSPMTSTPVTTKGKKAASSLANEPAVIGKLSSAKLSAMYIY